MCDVFKRKINLKLHNKINLLLILELLTLHFFFPLENTYRKKIIPKIVNRKNDYISSAWII